jgi:hypothetical protein
MLKIADVSTGTCIVAEAAGQITGDEYEVFAEAFENAVKENGTVDLVINLRGSVGYGDLDAFKDDWRFAFKQYRHARRVAIVGEQHMIVAAVRLFAPFTRAEERLFPPGMVDTAIDWACQSD